MLRDRVFRPLSVPLPRGKIQDSPTPLFKQIVKSGHSPPASPRKNSQQLSQFVDPTTPNTLQYGHYIPAFSDATFPLAMNYGKELQEVLAKHVGLSKADITLAMVMARVEQVYNLQLRMLMEGKSDEEKMEEFQRMQRKYLDYLDVCLRVVRDPTAEAFPSAPAQSDPEP